MWLHAGIVAAPHFYSCFTDTCNAISTPSDCDAEDGCQFYELCHPSHSPCYDLTREKCALQDDVHACNWDSRVRLRHAHALHTGSRIWCRTSDATISRRTTFVTNLTRLSLAMPIARAAGSLNVEKKTTTIVIFVNL
jgi:hypothetical protein